MITATLRQNGSALLAVQGKSMLPSLWPGDLVQIKRVDPKTLVVGDIILYRLQSRFCIHRIQAIRSGNDGLLFLTRGDSMPRSDPEFSEDRILGRVTNTSRAGREIGHGPKRSLWNRWVGTALSYDPMATAASRMIDEKMTWKQRRRNREAQANALAVIPDRHI